MITIDGYTRTCGLLGNPVEHTLSPVIHNTLAEVTGQKLVYVPFRVPAGHVEDAVKGALALNLLGMNVTVPYKSEVIPFLKEIDPLAEQIGAVNTLVRVEKGYKGYNTDMPGLYRAMCSDGVKLEQEKVLILGAGGVARAVAMMLARNNVAEIRILNRTVERAEKIAEEINALVKKSLCTAMALKDYSGLPQGEQYLAVQATNVGMYPNADDVVIENKEFYQKIHTGYDLIFNPAETKFMKLVKENGGKSYNGLKMLLYQGVIAYELWTKESIAEELALQVYEKMRRVMGLNES